jgi:hypothetical protein
LGAIASIAGVVVWVVGFSMGYLTFKSEMGSLREQVAELRAGKSATDNRLDALGNRLTSIESDTKYISQGVAELRLAAVPGKR